MARKGNPISVRLDLNRSSNSSWFSEMIIKQFLSFLLQIISHMIFYCCFFFEWIPIVVELFNSSMEQLFIGEENSGIGPSQRPTIDLNSSREENALILEKVDQIDKFTNQIEKGKILSANEFEDLKHSLDQLDQIAEGGIKRIEQEAGGERAKAVQQAIDELRNQENILRVEINKKKNKINLNQYILDRIRFRKALEDQKGF